MKEMGLLSDEVVGWSVEGAVPVVGEVMLERW